MKGQKRGTCTTCDGAIHFYPHLDGDLEPVLDEAGEVEGEWSHLNPASWIGNPHTPAAAAEEPTP